MHTLPALLPGDPVSLLLILFSQKCRQGVTPCGPVPHSAGWAPHVWMCAPWWPLAQPHWPGQSPARGRLPGAPRKASPPFLSPRNADMMAGRMQPRLSALGSDMGHLSLT